jgi:diguanylate cyclase (GGDEF)-like protein
VLFRSAVCYLDLDGFKPINDQYGHEAGDHLLIEVARRLQEIMRSDDTLARLGGDEFVLLLNDLEQEQECFRALERVLAVVSLPILAGDAQVELSASIGVALFPQDDADADSLLRHADQAMYRAKEAGKNRFHLYAAEQDLELKGHRQFLQRLREAHAQGEFTLHYQPKANLVSGEVPGVEALIRWQHPERGLLAPIEFLHYLTQSELGIEVGEWVIETALNQIVTWKRAGLKLSVSVNIDANHLQRQDFPERLRAALARHPEVSEGDLELEILESVAIHDLDRVSRTLLACQAMGVKFSLDDFGTGYSSLTYFRKLPVSTLKIDQGFVRGMLDDPEDLSIVESVVRLAGAFNRPVLAEGVESLEHGAMLVYLGCQLGQGYGIARPMPAEMLPDWLQRWQGEAVWGELADARFSREDVVLMVAASSHRAWVEHLASHLRVIGSERPPIHSRHCRFGRWYHGSGQVKYAELSEFVDLEPVHERVHALAGELVALVEAGRREAALARLPELYAQRDQFLAALDRLFARLTVRARSPH